MMQLLVRGPLDDLADLLNITRAKARKALKVKKVKVNTVFLVIGTDFVMTVEPNGSCCSKTSIVGSGK